jgi:hypothetical protein
VPLTMVVKIMLENTEDLRWMAILLDKSPPQAVASTGASMGASTGDAPPPDQNSNDANARGVA